MANTERALFVTRLGGIFAAVGSAVGLGNVWRFPYETGQNGGAAFLLVYLACVLLLGTPLLLAELTLGRVTHASPTLGFRRLAPKSKWYLLGYMGALCMLLIVGFYSVVAGWTLCYTVDAVMGVVPDFGQFSSSLQGPICWMTLFFVINAVILLGGVRKGIERASNILMPMLALMLVILCINSLLLPGSGEGLRFLFHPDFSKINSQVVLSALGQSFFSISVGICCLMTYGSYLPNSTKMGKTAISITMLDTLFAILAGIIIFPACFAYGVQPDAGPGLAFITLPSVFQQMPGGMFWCFCFFLLLAVAALTSSLSMLETPISILHEEYKLSRWLSVVIVTVVGWMLGVCCAMAPVVFDAFDNITANFFMPGCGFFMAIFVGWIVDQKIIRKAFSNYGTTSDWFYWPFRILVAGFAPLCILLIFLSGLGII